MLIDLHAHTTHSDGTLSPSALAEACRRCGVGVLAVTDHDTLGGVAEALAAGAALGVRVLWGVEFSARDALGDVHVLGYFPGPPPEAFGALLASQRAQRRARAQAMLDRLGELGKPVAWEDLRAAGAGDDAVGRPHVARALVERGHCGSVSEAFKRWLSPGRPAYVGHRVPSPEEAVKAIRQAGGVAVLAHPGHIKDPGTVDRAVAAGLQGLEVYHPDHAPGQVARFEALARQQGLIATGGADYHGLEGERFAKPGEYPTPPGELAKLEALWNRNVA